LKLSVPNQCTT